MRKLIFKTALFIAPFLLAYLLTLLFYPMKGGDLLRMGYIPYVERGAERKFDFIPSEVKFVPLSESKTRAYDIFTIGDSFSDQKEGGYQNFLAEHYRVLHLDRFLTGNPIQKLIGLVNGDFFDRYTVRYVVLEGVERHLIDYISDIDSLRQVFAEQLEAQTMNLEKRSQPNLFFSAATVKFPFYALKYFLVQDYLSNSQVYNAELTTDSLFSNGSNKLLFYVEDLDKTNQNNSTVNVARLNSLLNKISGELSQKGVRLIVLPAPDKYGMYYDYILNKTKFEKPLFFEIFEKLDKEYICIDSKRLLTDLDEKDLYYYDDTHWSPVGAKRIAEGLLAEIETLESQLKD